MDLLHRDEHGSFHSLCIGIVTGYGKDDAKMTLQVKLPHMEDGEDVLENVLWMLPYGGKDYGILHRPEIHDLVVIAFIGTHTRQGIALGCLNEKDCTLYNDATDKNEKKTWISKGGVCLEVWDEADKERLSLRCKGVELHLQEEKKTLELKDSEDKNHLTILAEDGKVQLEAAEELCLTCGKSSLVMKKDGNIKLTGDTLELTGTSGIQAEGKNALELKGTNIKVAASAKLECSGKGSLKVNSSGIVEVAGGIVKLG